MSDKKNSRPIIWLTATEAARAVGRHPSTVRTWAAAGDLTVRREAGGMKIKGCIVDGEPEVFVSQGLNWMLRTGRR